MIETPVRYTKSPYAIKIALMTEFVRQGQEVVSAVECAHDCVTAGHTPKFWRDQMGDEAADALDEDLKGMKEQ